MPYSGSGCLRFKNKNKQCLVSIDPDAGNIIVNYSQESDIFTHIGDASLFDKKYTIEKISVQLPYGKIKNGKINNLILKNYNPGTVSVFDSALVRALSLYENNVGIVTLTFIPASSLVSFSLEKEFDHGLSELVFRENRLRTRPFLSALIGNSKVNITGDRDLLIIRSNINLLRKRESVARAIGLMQRGRTLYRAGYFKRKLEMNFVRQDRVSPLGPIFDDDDDMAAFFSKYLAYEDALSGAESSRHRLAMEYLIDGCAGLPSLEHKVISLYNSLEIIDGSRTLNKIAIKSTLGISTEEAELINEVRNSLIHRGKTLSESVIDSHVKLKELNRINKMPFRYSGLSKTRIALHFHGYFLDRLFSYVSKAIGLGELPESYCSTYQ